MFVIKHNVFSNFWQDTSVETVASKKIFRPLYPPSFKKLLPVLHPQTTSLDTSSPAFLAWNFRLPCRTYTRRRTYTKSYTPLQKPQHLPCVNLNFSRNFFFCYGLKNILCHRPCWVCHDGLPQPFHKFLHQSQCHLRSTRCFSILLVLN